ncbi:DUF397 domain-containing protein [Streptomyces radiopugnans]|nr:DUF397 domain-containing protein [Streptomyces radiopugnans]
MSGACDELDRFESSRSGSEGDSCVEVAYRSGAVHVRDSEEEDGPVLALSPSAWEGFLGRAAR